MSSRVIISNVVLLMIIIIVGCSKKRSEFPDLTYQGTLEFPANEEPYSPIRLLFHNDTKYILENEGKQVIVYDKENRPIKTIGSEGSGPSEFMGPIDMAIIDTQLVVLDFAQLKLSVFTLRGAFIKSIILDFMPVSIAKSENSFLVSGMGIGEIPYIVFGFDCKQKYASKIITVHEEAQLPTSVYVSATHSFYIFSQLSYDNNIWIYEINPDNGSEIYRFSIPALFAAKDSPLPSSISDVVIYQNSFLLQYTECNNEGIYPIEMYSLDFLTHKVFYPKKSNPQMRLTINNDELFLVSPQDDMKIFLYDLLSK